MVTGGGPQSQNRAAMNCFFPMAFGDGARITVENQGSEQVLALYYYVDYESFDGMTDEALRFHAQWRRVNPTPPRLDLSSRANDFPRTNEEVNLDGSGNYTILEATGRGHYAGCNLSIDHINPIPNFNWFGEGDDFFWIDGEQTPSLMGTGTEDYFCAAWGYPGGFNSMPYHGISYPVAPDPGPDRYAGKWTMYRYHVEDPIMFERSLKFSIETGHATSAPMTIHRLPTGTRRFPIDHSRHCHRSRRACRFRTTRAAGDSGERGERGSGPLTPALSPPGRGDPTLVSLSLWERPGVRAVGNTIGSCVTCVEG